MLNRLRSSGRYLWTGVLFYLLILSHMLLMPRPWWYLGNMQRPVQRVIERTLADYTLHALAFALLAGMIHAAQRSTNFPTPRNCLASLLVYSIATELLQSVIPQRSCHWLDATANVVGIIVVWIFLSVVWSQRLPSEDISCQQGPVAPHDSQSEMH